MLRDGSAKQADSNAHLAQQLSESQNLLRQTRAELERMASEVRCGLTLSNP